MVTRLYRTLGWLVIRVSLVESEALYKILSIDLRNFLKGPLLKGMEILLFYLLWNHII